MALYKTYTKDQKKCAVTFELSPEAANGAEQVWLAGDFNSWSSIDTPMKKLKNGTFKVKLTLEAGKEYQFRYLLDLLFNQFLHLVPDRVLRPLFALGYRFPDKRLLFHETGS